jgi:hypothetical protein
VLDLFHGFFWWGWCTVLVFGLFKLARLHEILLLVRGNQNTQKSTQVKEGTKTYGLHCLIQSKDQKRFSTNWAFYSLYLFLSFLFVWFDRGARLYIYIYIYIYIYRHLPIQIGAIIEQGKEENEDTICSKPVLLLHACIWAA